MTNAQLLSAAIRIWGLYFLITTVAQFVPIVTTQSIDPNGLQTPILISFLVPQALSILLLLAMVIIPDRIVQLASRSAKNSDDRSATAGTLDLALIGVRLLGLYFVILAVPGLADMPRTFDSVTTGGQSLAAYIMRYLFSTFFYLIVGLWMLIGGERMARFIQRARTANFERSGTD